jgi:hypothetical protein
MTFLVTPVLSWVGELQPTGRPPTKHMRAAMVPARRWRRSEIMTMESLNRGNGAVCAVALVHKRPYGGGPVETVDLGRYIEDLAKELIASFGRVGAMQIFVDVEPTLRGPTPTAC